MYGFFTHHFVNYPLVIFHKFFRGNHVEIKDFKKRLHAD